MTVAPSLDGTPPEPHTGHTTEGPAPTTETFISADGRAHRVLAHIPDAPLRGVLVAIHGFNDHAGFMTMGAQTHLRAHRIAVYAYDQRGFGTDPEAGSWPGKDALIDDLKRFTRFVRDRHREVPIYLLGESMGGAVAMLAMTDPHPPDVHGVILSAPAVWARATQPFYQRWGLWLAARIAPRFRFNAQTLRIQASDNIAMLEALNDDPLFIKATRTEALKGVVDVMDAAFAAAERLTARTLILYGGRDQVIPKRPVRLMIEKLPAAARKRQTVALYPRGWHMLGRDLNAATVWRDIIAWIDDPDAPLPSGADKTDATVFFAPERTP